MSATSPIDTSDMIAVHDALRRVLQTAPEVLERVDNTAEVTRIAGQHRDVDGALQTAEARLASWAASPTSANADALAESLTALYDVLAPHLAEEEAVILPLARVTITQEEWGGLATHGMTHFTGDKMWLILGLILESMTDQQRANMVAHMPPPAAEFWTTVGEPQFDNFIATVRS